MAENRNFFFKEITVTVEDYPSSSQIKFPTTMTHIILVNDGDVNLNDKIFFKFIANPPNTIDGILKARCDGPIVFDGVSISKIWLKKAAGAADTVIRVWAWRRSGG